MMRKIVCIASFLFNVIIVHSQISCADVHNGLFYYYPKNTNYHYTEYFENNLQHEVNNTTGDTALWLVKWKSNCEFKCRYITGNQTMDDKTRRILKTHALVYVIETVTPDYYVFKGYLDTKNNNQPLQMDTIWLHEKTTFTNTRLFEDVPDTTVIQQQHFADTSQYALMYVYRPGKVALSLSDFLVYFDENALYMAQNNRGYVFKILKEGKFMLRTSEMKDSVQLPVDIHFGNRYYIKSEMQWGMHSKMHNFKLELNEVDAATGSKEFSGVKMKR